jgi:hypothetical protein
MKAFLVYLKMIFRLSNLYNVKWEEGCEIWTGMDAEESGLDLLQHFHRGVGGEIKIRSHDTDQWTQNRTTELSND